MKHGDVYIAYQKSLVHFTVVRYLIPFLFYKNNNKTQLLIKIHKPIVVNIACQKSLMPLMKQFLDSTKYFTKQSFRQEYQ